jgi:hypothetical protein
MNVLFEKKNSSFAKMKSYLDAHLRVVHAVLMADEDMYFLGPFFLNFGSFYSHFRLAPNEGKAKDVKLSVYKYKIIFWYPFGRCMWVREHSQR